MSEDRLTSLQDVNKFFLKKIPFINKLMESLKRVSVDTSIAYDTMQRELNP